MKWHVPDIEDDINTFIDTYPIRAMQEDQWCDLFQLPNDSFKPIIFTFVDHCKNNDVEHILQSLDRIPSDYQLQSLRAGFYFICNNGHLDTLKLLYPIYHELISGYSLYDVLTAKRSWLFGVYKYGHVHIFQWLCHQWTSMPRIFKPLFISYWDICMAWLCQQYELFHFLVSHSAATHDEDDDFDWAFDELLNPSIGLECYLNRGFQTLMLPGKKMQMMHAVMTQQREKKIDQLYQCAMYTGLCRDVMFECAQFISFDHII